MSTPDLSAVAREVLRLSEESTSGEWRTSRKDMDSYTADEHGETMYVCYVYRGEEPRIPFFGLLGREDAELTAYARNNIDALATGYLAKCAEVERLREHALSLEAQIMRDYEAQAYAKLEGEHEKRINDNLLAAFDAASRGEG